MGLLMMMSQELEEQFAVAEKGILSISPGRTH
jgi:hypothetical protein